MHKIKRHKPSIKVEYPMKEINLPWIRNLGGAGVVPAPLSLYDLTLNSQWNQPSQKL